MPNIGETITGRERGLKSGMIFTWQACIDCGNERWVPKKKFEQGTHQRCRNCTAKLSNYSGTKVKFTWSPEIVDMKRSCEIGKVGDCLYCLVPCPECGKERWVRWAVHRKRPDTKCNSCAAREVMLKMPHFKGRKKPKHHDGYILVWLPPNDPFYSMCSKAGYVMEHRLVMAKHLGRQLEHYETVHHKGERYIGIKNKSDNLIDNLELRTGKHGKGVALMCADCELRKEIKLLKWQVTQLNEKAWERVA